MNAKRFTLGVALCATWATIACNERGLSYGDANSVIAVMPAELWDEVSEDVYGAIEQRIMTVRDEKTFTVTYQEPYAEHWMELRRFRQMLLVGTLSDEWIQEALERRRAPEEPITTTGVHQVTDAWSNGQTVTLVILSDGGGREEVQSHLAEVQSLLDRQFRAYARNRMYFSGVDSALADTLNTEAGFLLLLPNVYRWWQSDSVYVFRNDNPDPSELIRQVAVTWKTPAPVQLDDDDILEWRAALVEGYYGEPQDVVLDGLIAGPLEGGDHEAYQVQAQWRNPPERSWPAGGPFLTRTVTCDHQDRTYLIDAWLYAPGKEKYEYMIQLETILGTFRCD